MMDKFPKPMHKYTQTIFQKQTSRHAATICFLGMYCLYQLSVPLTPFIVTICESEDHQTAPESSHRNLRLHSSYPRKCGQLPDNNSLVLSNIIDIAYNDPPKVVSHRIPYTLLSHSVRKKLLEIQVCMYDNLIQWNRLAKELEITNWATHGGSAIGAKCYGGLNPWDDDIDVTIQDCSKLDELWNSSEADIAKYHPTLNPKSYSMNESKVLWEPRLIKPDLLLLRGSLSFRWYKLKTIREAYLWTPGVPIRGLDMECISREVSGREIRPKSKSKWFQYMAQNKSMITVPYGPTTIQTVPPDILDSYIQLRYGKDSPCQFPFTNGAEPEYFPTNVSITGDQTDNISGNIFQDDQLKSSIHFPLEHWYIPLAKRKEWKELAGDKKQMEYTAQIPNLDLVEVDNSISTGCSWGTPPTLKVIGWNAKRGKYWHKFYKMVKENEELKEPLVILMNDMDIGMARSGNVHTTRRLALELGMNYAYGVQFLELTRGIEEEQITTEGLRDALSLNGNAILSKCIIGDTMILRDPLPPNYFSDGANNVNGNGYEIRLGGRMGLFGRIFQSHHRSILPSHSVNATGFDYRYLEEIPPHFVVGNVHRLEESDANREKLWDYYGFGKPTSKGSKYDGKGVSEPSTQIGVVVQGDFGAKFCSLGGLDQKNQGEPTFRVHCKPNRQVLISPTAGDHFCSNLPVSRRVQVTAPCDWGNNSSPLTMGNHAIVSIILVRVP